MQADGDEFELLDELGRGGMGVVYRARQRVTGREVALKVLAPGADAQTLRRFRREAETLARVQHPHVVRIHAAYADAQGRPHLALELVDGLDLAERLRRQGPLPPRDAAALIADAAAGLAAAHAVGVIHRDVKPENLLLDAEGRVKLTDFGLVRDLDPGLDATRLSKTGVFLGTPAYWPPEQAQGDHQAVDARSDVFGLGGALFCLLTGEPPHGGSSLAACLGKLQAPPRPPSELRAEVPKDLDAIALRCLARDPAQRYPTAEALGADLRAFLAGRRPAARAPRRRAWVVAGVALGGLALGLALVGLRAALDAPAPRDRAVTPDPEVSPTRVSPERALLAAAEALARDASRDHYAGLLTAAAALYDPGRRQPDFAAARALLTDPADPYQRHAVELLAQLEHPVGLDVEAELSHPAWVVLAHEPLSDADPGRGAGLDAVQQGRLLALVHELGTSRPRRDDDARWRLLVRRAQQLAAEALWTPGVGLPLTPPQVSRAAEGLAQLDPEGRPARRIELLLTVASLGVVADTRGVSPAWPELDEDPAFRLLQLGVNLAHGDLDADALVAAVEAASRGRDATVRRSDSALQRAMQRLVEWAYLYASGRGRRLTADELAGLRRVQAALEAALDLPANEPYPRWSRAGLVLLGPDPADEWPADAGDLAEAELRLIQGAPDAAAALLRRAPQTMAGLWRHATGEDGAGPPQAQRYDARPCFPWHAQPWLPAVLAGERWWPGPPIEGR